MLYQLCNSRGQSMGLSTHFPSWGAAGAVPVSGEAPELLSAGCEDKMLSRSSWRRIWQGDNGISSASENKWRAGEAAAQLWFGLELSKGKDNTTKLCLSLPLSSGEGNSIMTPEEMDHLFSQCSPSKDWPSLTCWPWTPHWYPEFIKHILFPSNISWAAWTWSTLSISGSRKFSSQNNNCTWIISFLMGSTFPIIILPSCQHSVNGRHFLTD